MADRIAVMNEGLVVQIGTPEALYDRPATRFVADFLGEANFVEGISADGPDGPCVQTPVGVVPAGEGGPAPGTKVVCCVRPERIRLQAGAPPPDRQAERDEAAVPATVLSCTYLGDLRQYVCDVGPAGPWKVSVLAGAQPPLAAGQAVTLRFSAADVAILPA